MIHDEIFEEAERRRYEDEMRQRYEAGEKSALLWCLDTCLHYNRPIPDWLKEAFHKAYDAALCHEFASWDDVFGKPLAKGKRLATERRNYEIGSDLYMRVDGLKSEGLAIDKAIAKAAEEFKLGYSVARNLYYEILKVDREASREWHEMDLRREAMRKAEPK
jgi:hypothetical protein